MKQKQSQLLNLTLSSLLICFFFRSTFGQSHAGTAGLNTSISLQRPNAKTQNPVQGRINNIKEEKSKAKEGNEKYTQQQLNMLLSIHNDSDFERKVIKMMKDDDSDVLKDINEDEEPLGKGVPSLPIGVQANPDLTKARVSRSEVFRPDKVYQLTLTKKDSSLSWKRNNIIKYSNLTFNASEETNNNVPMGNFPNYTDYTSYGPPPLDSQEDTKPTPEMNLGKMPTRRVQYFSPSRLCKPGPPIPANPYLPNCLIIGDSIAASYFYAVSEALRGRCLVQLSPYSKAGVALDSKYGIDCLKLLLSTTDLKPTYYDVIIFNFGLHDINYQGIYSEEFVGDNDYARNLGRIKKKLLQTGASVSFALTTPVTFNGSLNEYVLRYNEIARRVMRKTETIETIDLYQMVIDECGHPPFDKCYMTKKHRDVHYSVAGSIMLGKLVAAQVAKLLQARGQWASDFPSRRSHVNPLYDLRPGSHACPNAATRCPYNSVCLPNVISRSGYACCMLRNGVDCGDSWHCCPSNTRCHPLCKETWCTCIS